MCEPVNMKIYSKTNRILFEKCTSVIFSKHVNLNY